MHLYWVEQVGRAGLHRTWVVMARDSEEAMKLAQEEVPDNVDTWTTEPIKGEVVRAKKVFG